MTRQEVLQKIRENGWNLEWIPDEMKDYALCKEAVQSVSTRIAHCQSILCYVPKPLLDKELCRIALKKDGDALRDIPMEMRDRELCLLAVQSFGPALRDVPWHFRDREICEYAVQEDGGAFASVPEHLKSEDLAYWMVKTRPQDLDMIPDKCLSERVYLRAMRYERHKIRQDIPEETYRKLMYG